MSSLSLFIIIVTILILGYFGIRKWQQVGHFTRTYHRDAQHLLSRTFLITGLVLALLAPLDLIDFSFDSTTHTQWGDVVFILDVSKSMDARDIDAEEAKISRLETAKDIINAMLWAHPEHRYGLVLFAGQARLASPLTTDTETLTHIIDDISTNTIREGGTDIGSALSLATRRFSQSGAKSIVLLTDGGEPDDIHSWEEIDQTIKDKDGIRYTILGIGTEAGSTIPLWRDLLFGNEITKTYEGREVITRLGKENLERLSAISHASSTTIGTKETHEAEILIQKNITTSNRKTSENQNITTRYLIALSSLCFFIHLICIPKKILHAI